MKTTTYIILSLLFYLSIPFSQSIIIFIPAFWFMNIFLNYKFKSIFVWKIICITVIFLLFAFGVMRLHHKKLIIQEKTEEQNFLILQNQYLHYEIEQMHLQEETTRQIRHDFNNHLLTINILASHNHDMDVLNYIQNLQADFNQNKNCIHSGNIIINGICNYYIAVAQNFNINVTCNVSVPKNIALNEKDITILLGNIWLNCIENAKNSFHPFIDIQLLGDNNRLMLSSKNSYQGKRKTNNGNYLSTKKNAKNHGMGTKNMQQVVNKYNGYMKLENTTDTFHVNILLFL
ncbi:MAG: ATP-binding protein [Lachnospiraceae bacterium]